MRRSTTALIIVFLAILLGGCGRVVDHYHPRTALAKYVQHIKGNDSKAAYEMLSKKLRGQLSYKAFARKWKKNYAELQIQGADIEKQLAKAKQYEITAKIKIGQKRSIRLTQEQKRWRIVAGLGGGGGVAAPTPRAAVAALVRALEDKNLSAFLKLLSKERREKFVREMTLRLEKIKANLDRDFEVSGNRARLQYDPRYWIMLVKEKGAWRVVEFN